MSGQQIKYVAKNVKLSTVFTAIGKQSGFSFFYRTELLAGLKRVNVSFKGISITQALDKCLANTPLSYTIIDSTVIIAARKSKSVVPIKK